MREEIRKAGLPIRIWPGGNGLLPGAGRPDLADLRAVTNLPGPARSRVVIGSGAALG
jgi:hypothetical protein